MVPEACRSLGLEHRIHSQYEKNIVERAIQYLKDRALMTTTPA